jgi:hypothetical protein
LDIKLPRNAKGKYHFRGTCAEIFSRSFSWPISVRWAVMKTMQPLRGGLARAATVIKKNRALVAG